MFILFTSSFIAIDFIAHSLNRINLLKRFVRKGETFFKIDFSPIVTSDCIQYSTQRSSTFKQIVIDEEMGCIGLFGDFSSIPYADLDFDTSEDFFQYINSDEFEVESKQKKRTIRFLISFQIFPQIQENSDLLIDFMIKLINVANNNKYFVPVLSRCYPDYLVSYCNSNPQKCNTKKQEFDKIIGDNNLHCESSFRISPQRLVYNEEITDVDARCSTGFTRQYEQSDFPYIFYELSTRSGIAKFLNKAENDCPGRKNHDVILTTNVDREHWNKIVNYNYKKEDINSIYTQLSLSDGQTKFLDQKISHDLNIGVHVSVSPISILDVQFFTLDQAGDAMLLNHLNYPISSGFDFISLQIYQNYAILFFKKSIYVHSLSNNGGRFESVFKLTQFELTKYATLKTFEFKSKQLEFAAITKIENENLVISLIRVVDSTETLIKTKVIKSDKLINSKHFVFSFGKSEDDIYLAFDSDYGSSIFTYFAKLSLTENEEIGWENYLGSLLDFQIDFEANKFVFLVGDSPIYYGNIIINNNRFDKCSNYFYLSTKKLRENHKFVTSYFAGPLDMIGKIGNEESLNICDSRMRFGTLGNSENAKVSFKRDGSHDKAIISEQVALTNELDAFTNIFASRFDMNEGKERILIFEIDLSVETQRNE